MSDGRDEAGVRLVLRIVGWTIFAALGAVQLWALGRSDDAGEVGLLAIVAREGGVLWWAGDSDGADDVGLLAWMGCALPLFFVPLAFGGLAWNFPPLARPWRIAAISVALVMTVVSLIVAQTRDGRDGGFATVAGAAWIEDGVVVARRPWSAAVRIEAGCAMVARRRRYRTTVGPESVYRVDFAEGRVARLLFRRFGTAWLDDIEPIDAALRAVGLPRVGDIHDDCITAVLPDNRAAQQRFKALLTP